MSKAALLPPLPPTDGGLMLEVQRSLGRIEGLQGQLLGEFKSHRDEDKETFKAIVDRLNAQDAKIDDLQSERDRAKGAGKVILALLGSFSAFVGGAVIAVLEGWIKVKFH